MKKRKWSVGEIVLTVVIGVVILFGQVAAEPIGLITVSSESDAGRAGEIIGSGYARVGNQFLVSANPAEQSELATSGFRFIPVLGGAEADDVYQIYSLDHPKAPEPVSISALGQFQELAGTVRLAVLSRAAAASLSNIDGLVTARLTDHKIPIQFQPPVIATVPALAYPVDDLAGLVNVDSVYAFDQRLQDFETRYAYTDSSYAARAWLVQKFRDWGYTTIDTPRFYYNGWHYNVQVTKPGTVHPDQYIVVGGHYDSYTNNSQSPGPYQYAPGADDDGSGVALTMELARVLADVPLRKSIIFMPFGAEELGLKGSWDASGDFAFAGTKLEVMFNYDMVGFTDDAVWDLDLSSGDIVAYRDLSAATAARVTLLDPVITYMGSSSDHYPFDQNGFNIVNSIESDFNWDGWHTNLDLTSRMNFPYLAEVVKMALVSAAIVAESPYPATVDQVVDVGDGQSLQVSWSECSSDCSYSIYWGLAEGDYLDSAVVPTGQCNYTITGLAEGVYYHILAVGETPDGYRAVHGIEGGGTPRLYPLAPGDVVGTVDPDQLRLSISWLPGAEIDLSHYNLYRRVSEVGTFGLYQTDLTGTQFDDYNVMAQVLYEYRVASVDNSGLESELSEIVSMYPASYDGGPVLVDAFAKVNDSEPLQVEQEAWFDSLFDGYSFTLAQSDELAGPVTLGDVGRFGTMFWIDDDIVAKDIQSSASAVTAMAEHQTDMLIAGWKTWFDWVGKTVPTSHVLNSEFRISAYDYSALWDFVGAHGQNGWPSVAIDPARGPNDFRDVAKLTPRSGAQVIYTFDSKTDAAGWEGEPVGLAYDGPNGKRVVLSFPLYYLDQAEARALMARVIEFFDNGVQPTKGDVDESGSINIGDIALLVDHLFIMMNPLPNPDLAEVDGLPGLSIGDVYYLIEYLFIGGPPPIE